MSGEGAAPARRIAAWLAMAAVVLLVIVLAAAVFLYLNRLDLARRAALSERTFARRFRAETGTTPHSWVTRQRVQAAEELLERTDHPIEWIADEVGFGNAAALRDHFTRFRGVSPQQYRRSFCRSA